MQITGADCNSDHVLLVAEIRTKLKKVLRKARSVVRYDWQALESDIDIRAEYAVEWTIDLKTLMQWTVLKRNGVHFSRHWWFQQRKFCQGCKGLQSNRG